jgi:hypothetical protein
VHMCLGGGGDEPISTRFNTARHYRKHITRNINLICFDFTYMFHVKREQILSVNKYHSSNVILN